MQQQQMTNVHAIVKKNVNVTAVKKVIANADLNVNVITQNALVKTVNAHVLLAKNLMKAL